MKIQVFSITQQLSTDQVSPQRGDVLRFSVVSKNPHEVKSVSWKFSDGTTNTCFEPTHTFNAPNDEPGIGVAGASATVFKSDGTCQCLTTCFIIVPKINCTIECDEQQKFEINRDTDFVTIETEILCEEIDCENVLQDQQLKNCAICEPNWETCKVCVGKVKGDKIFLYGVHCLCLPIGLKIESQNADCKCFKTISYAPICKKVAVKPQDLCIAVSQADCAKNFWDKRFTLQGLSLSMLPKDSKIDWRIYDQADKTLWCETTPGLSLCYEFRREDYYCVEATIRIPECLEDTVVKVYIMICDPCDDCKNFVHRE